MSVRSRLGDPIGGAMGGLVRASIWVFSARLLGVLLSFVVTIIVARWYGKEATGFVALINSSALVFGTAAAFGQGTYLIRELSKVSTTHHAVWKRQLYQRSLKLILIISLLLAVPTILALRQMFADPAWKTSTLAIGIVAVALVARAFVQLTVNTSRALAPMHVYAALLLLPPVVNLATVVIWGSLANTAILVPSAALAFATVAAGATALSYNLLKLRRDSEAAAESTPQASSEEPLPSLLGLLKAGLPFLIATGSTVLLTEGNVVIAGFFLPASEIGVYSVAHRAAYLAAFALTSISLVSQPRFARLRTGNPDEIRRYGRHVSNLIFWVTVPLVVAFILVRHWLIETAFGPGFEGASTPLVILLFGHTVAALTGATNPYLSMTGGQYQLAKITIVAAGLSVALTMALTPLFGLYGPAIAVSAGLAFLNITTLVTIRLRDGFWLCWMPRSHRSVENLPSRREGGR